MRLKELREENKYTQQYIADILNNDNAIVSLFCTMPRFTHIYPKSIRYIYRRVNNRYKLSGIWMVEHIISIVIDIMTNTLVNFLIS